VVEVDRRLEQRLVATLAAFDNVTCISPTRSSSTSSPCGLRL